MPVIRLMVWNMEWLNDLFVAGNPPRFRPDGDKPQHSGSGVTVAMRKAALRGALTELNPDAPVIVEGPSDPAEMQLFFDDWQPNAWATHLQKTSRSTQNIDVAVKTRCREVRRATDHRLQHQRSGRVQRLRSRHRR